jgi:hypothetical protein
MVLRGWLLVLFLCLPLEPITRTVTITVVRAAIDDAGDEPDHPSTTLRLDRSRLAPFDTDIREDCRSLLVHCTSELFAHVYLQCPKSCSKLLEEEGMIGTAHQNPDALWDDNDNSNSNNNNVRTLRTYRGKRIDADRFEGYVTVISIVPLLPGMAVYFYEMMEHLHSVFAPTVEFVVIPLDLEQGIHISLREHPSVVVLEEESASVVHTHPWLRHLTSITPRTGAATKDHHDTLQQVPLQTDRVNTYIVSADGYYIERLTSPTMAILQQKIAVYLKTIDYEL